MTIATRDLFVDVRGLRLHVKAWPAAEGARGPATILLHGWLDHCGSFDRLAPLLVREGPAYAVDLRGHGLSAWVGPGGFYHLVEYVADLDGLLDALQIQGPVRLVGHSLGGGVSLIYAAARPDRVAHTTLLDAMMMAVQPGDVPGRITSYLDDLRQPRARRVVGTLEAAIDRLVRWNARLPREVAAHLAEGNVSPDEAQGGALAWRWDPLLRGHSPLPLLEDTVRAIVGKIQAPLLLVRAEGGMISDLGAVREWLSGLPSLDVVSLADVSHHLHLEKPAEVAAALLHAWELAARAGPRSG